MTQNGIVTAIEGNKASVEFVRNEACAQCRMCQLGTDKRVAVLIDNTLGANVGDEILVELHGGSVIKASATAYLIPLFGLILGLIAGAHIAEKWIPGVNPELFSCLCALALTALSFLYLRLTEKKRSRSKQYDPQMLSIVQKVQQ